MKSRLILCVTLIIMFGLLGRVHAGETIKDFTTDGCSLSPDGTPADPDKWCECCVEHDKLYWKGGTYTDRLNADIALGKCVTEDSGSAVLGNAYFLGVRIGGSPYFDTPFRWGYGWNYGRGYKALTPAEAADANKKLNTYMDKHPDPCAELF